jgi:acetylornithine deacetylase/succinyl-diaminopimelate desuccinylase-like protein
MNIEPTSARIRGGRLYGRGACDMKSALAAFMVAMAAIGRSGIKLGGRLVFGSEVGEEGGGWRLTDLLDGPGRADAVICGEPTNLELHIGNRGWFQMNITTCGIATHSGTAQNGVNAIEKMAAVISAVYGLPCFERSDPIWGRSPVNVQYVHGGGKVSGAVADECEAHFDVRLNPDLAPATLARELDLLLDAMRASDPHLQVEWAYRPDWPKDLPAAAPAVHLPAAHPFVASVAEACLAATGVRARFGGFPGGCAAGICLERGTPAVVLGPGSLAQAHSADEWVEVEQVTMAARIYTLAALGYLGTR